MLWYQRVDTLTGGEGTEEGEDEPDADHRPAVSDGQVREAGQHGSLLFARIGLIIARPDVPLRDARLDIGRRASDGATKVGRAIDFGRVSNRAARAYA